MTYLNIFSKNKHHIVSNKIRTPIILINKNNKLLIQSKHIKVLRYLNVILGGFIF